MPRLIFLAVATAFVAALAVTSAQAQFGPLFGDGPPRPPGSIRGAPPPPPMDDDEEVPELPQGRLLPTPNRPLPGQGNLGAPPPGTYQTQPLPPPPGTTVVPQNPPAAAAPPGAPPPAVANAPASKGGTPRGTAPPTPATLQPGDEVVSEPAKQKIVNKKATFSGLDKITGRITSFDADIGETVQFGALRVKPDACYTRPATEAANTDAFVEVDEITLQGEVKRIFSGWMFAASPGLHGVEHPIYDIWLSDCKAPDTTVVAQQPDKPPPVAAPAPQKQRAPPKQAPRPQPSGPPPQPIFPPFGR
jgi:hypothetical protein